MTGHKNIEEQHCQRKTVAPRTRPDFAAGHFRSHEARSPQNSTRPAIHIDVVGIANSYIPGIWIEGQIAEIDVARAEAAGMQLQETVRHGESDGRQRTELRFTTGPGPD